MFVAQEDDAGTDKGGGPASSCALVEVDRPAHVSLLEIIRVSPSMLGTSCWRSGTPLDSCTRGISFGLLDGPEV